jgi:hypothetical protein
MAASAAPWFIQAKVTAQSSRLPNSAARGTLIGLALSVFCWLGLLLIVVQLVR